MGKRKKSARALHPASRPPADFQPSEPAASEAVRFSSVSVLYAIGGLFLLGAFAVAYSPTCVLLWDAWMTEPDYSHGILVIPLALTFLWLRWDTFPGFTGKIAWTGLILIAASIGLRVLGSAMFLAPLDGWSIVLWIAGSIALLFGWRVFLWAAPSIAFLFFMVPLPFRVEHSLSRPLKDLSTSISCWVLQLIGEPAIAEGHTILIGEEQFGVADACSGLRIFVGIFALAFAYMIIVRKSWWERALILLAAFPIAVVANSTRVIITILLIHHGSKEWSKWFHDSAGVFMIPFAALLFALVLGYLSLLIRTEERAAVGHVLRR